MSAITMLRLSRTARSLHAVAAPILCCVALSLASPSSLAQIPRINTLFPIGGRAGSTVDVEIRGSSLDGASLLMVHGSGVTGTIEPGGAKVDETNKPIWQSKCGSCHELRSPANRSLSPGQWAATVERMVKVRQAPLSAAEAEKVTQYLVGAARAGRITAQVKVAPDTLPGLYEMRVVGSRGVSTAGLFEVGNLPEVLAAANAVDTPLPITLPCAANGSLSGNGERNYFKFAAKKGQRLVFNMKAFRYNEQTQVFFNPDLRLYDSTGKQLVENHGYYELDPLIDWTCPVDGEYIIEARDLLGRGNPGNVYRLVMGAVPYDTALYPAAAQAGAKVSLSVLGKNTEGLQTAYLLPAPRETGMELVGSPFGPQDLYISRYPVARAETKVPGGTALPAGFTGRIEKAGAAQTFLVQGNGVFEFEGYAERLNSPLRFRFSLQKPDGSTIAAAQNEQQMTARLESGKPYMLKVEPIGDGDAASGPYFVEARPDHPQLECVARPANICLRPGLSTPVQIILTRRGGIDGDVRITATDLPPGVTAEPAVIQPDRGDTLLILKADAGAGEVQKPITITASAHGPAGDFSTPAKPQEMYILQNNPTPIDRMESVVAVRGQPDFTASLESDAPIMVHPKKGVEVKVKVKRSAGFKGNVTVQVNQLPSGWVCNAETIGPDRDEVTVLVRPDGNDTRPFRNRDPKMTPIRAVVEANSDEFVFVVGTLPVSAAPYKEEENNR